MATISTQPWRLQGIGPDTTDITVDVPGTLDFPRAFDGRTAKPLSGTVPIVYTRNGGLQKRTMRVPIHFRPGPAQAADVAAAFAAIENIGPYLLTLPGGEELNVLVDPSQGELGFTWEGGARQFMVAFVEV